MPLEESLVIALTDHQGDLGDILLLAKHYEAGQWEEIEFKSLAAKGISNNQLRKLYIESLKSAKEIYQL
ncbi:MAG: hypothetical protein ACTIM4_07225 [Marinomonas sp.]